MNASGLVKKDGLKISFLCVRGVCVAIKNVARVCTFVSADDLAVTGAWLRSLGGLVLLVHSDQDQDSYDNQKKSPRRRGGYPDHPHPLFRCDLFFEIPKEFRVDNLIHNKFIN